MPARRIGSFDLERQLGVGGMGTVYLAVHRASGQHVALKVLAPALSADKKLLSRFEREIEILKKLEHPNIVRYYGGGRHGSQRYYAMEYMDGGSLDTILEEKGRLDWEQTIQIALQLCAALEHAHSHGIIHRDLKPGNLFMSTQGDLRLGDFGIARDTEATALTAAGKTVGTYAYMAPEQIHGKAPIGPRTDLYAMGCLLFQFLTGHAPFQGTNAAELFMQHINEDPGSVREHALDCPIWLDKVVRKLLAKEPEDRPYDALAVQALLEDVKTQVAAGTSASAAALTVAGTETVLGDIDRAALPKAIKPRRKKKKKQKAPFYETVPFLLTCLLALIGGVTWAVWPPGEEELFREARKVMLTDDADLWREAQEDFIEPYLERFPDGQHVEQMREFDDQIEMERAERQAMSRVERGRDPRSEAERKFVEADRYERFGDRVKAMQLYEGLVQVFGEREEDRPFVNLSRRRMFEIGRTGPGTNTRLEIVNEALRRAEDLFARGLEVDAEKIWRSVIALYEENLELAQHVEFARQRLARTPVSGFPFEDTQ